MPTAEEFDEFYVSSRRGLVLGTFALTGDLVAARSAVRDAYVAARHHWDKVGRTADPEAWVRPRAWSAAQRRHTARPWHREKHVDAEQARTLEALHELSDGQRRTLVLTHLTDLPLHDIARELGFTVAVTADFFESATDDVARHLDVDPAEIPARLEDLGAAADTVKLPRPTIIRRNGLRRRRNHAVVGSVLVAGIALGAGAFVTVAAPAVEKPRVGALVSKKMLLTDVQAAPLAPGQPWAVASTTDNTEGTNGLNTTCQKDRFADPKGLGTWVRKFVTTTGRQRSLVQTVEISNSPGAARQAYDTTVGWYAGCTVARVQLIDAYTIGGVGDQAQVIRLSIPDTTDHSYVVGIARTGALTTSTVLETQTDAPVNATLVANALAASVQNLCSSKVAGDCVGAVTTAAAFPPPSGETAGMLAIADLPPIAKISEPWAGTKAVSAVQNRASTTCDNANFAAAGATKLLGRAFLIPQARVPAQFGITETIGAFASPKAARKFVLTVASRMKTCPDRELSSSISRSFVQTDGGKKAVFAYWRLDNQVNKNSDEVSFWMGITQVGPYVAQVSLTPVGAYDVSSKTFSRLLLRSRERLYEVQ